MHVKTKSVNISGHNPADTYCIPVAKQNIVKRTKVKDPSMKNLYNALMVPISCSIKHAVNI